MRTRLTFRLGVMLLSCAVANLCSAAPAPPDGVVAFAGDRSAIVAWNRSLDPTVATYAVYGSTAESGPFTLLADKLSNPGYAHLAIANGQPRFYRVRAVTSSSQSSSDSVTVRADPHLFASDDDFLDYVQRAHFNYFWFLANPANGLVPDRSTATSPCSVAAVGFGLSAITVGVEHGWISRSAGRQRAALTLQTFWNSPQGPAATNVIGYRGWFYHFLDMKTPARTWSCELSSIDTALFLAGVLDVRQFFDGADADETSLRALSTSLLERVDWNWMRNGQAALTMGWKPESGFLSNLWLGYNEAMLLYLLGLGAANNPLPASAWTAWTSSYSWRTNYGQGYVNFAPLFGHQYSHCWVDFRHTADAYMREKASTYFENSRRATLAQRSYCQANPGGFAGYSTNLWGLTACDGPGTGGIAGYNARGAPPAQNDDGTLAPTAVGGSLPFAPEICLPTLRRLYDTYRQTIWTPFGFRDAFNLRVNWWDPDTLGIDQGPIVLMIENYRTQNIWRRGAAAPEIQRGLARAGFQPVVFVSSGLTGNMRPGGFELQWPAQNGQRFQVEASPDLKHWSAPPNGDLSPGGPALSWSDPGAPAATTNGQRFYRIFQFGP